MKPYNVFLFITRRLYLFFYLLRKQFIRMFFSSLGLLLSLILIFSILGILRPLKKFVVDQFEKNLPLDTILVKANTENRNTSSLISLLRKKQDITLGIPENKIREIKNWKEIKSVTMTQILQKPVMGKFDHPVLSKMGIAFDLLIQGVSYNRVSSQLRCMRDFKITYEINEQGEKIPVIPLILPESFAEMAYAYTMMNGLPTVTKKSMIGLRLNLSLGQSVINANDGNGIQYTGIVCGFVPQNIVSIIGAPLEWVRELHMKDHQIRAANSYDKLFIELRSIQDNDFVIKRLKNMNLLVMSERNSSINKISKWLDNLDILLWAFVAILLVISAISLANSFMILTTQKRFEFGLYLVFGASPFFLWLLIFVEGAFWGAFHSSIAFYLAQNFSGQLQKSLQILPVLNELKTEIVFFNFSLTYLEKWYLISGSILFAGLSSLLPAIFMTGRKTLSLIKKD